MYHQLHSKYYDSLTLAESGLHFANHTWCNNVHPHDRSIREAVTSDVPCSKAVATQPVHDLVHQARYPLFLCVRPRLILSLSSLLLSKLAKLLTELMVTLRYSILLLILIELLNVYGYVPIDGWQFDLMLMLQYVPMFTLTPRFILSIRELYALDVQGRRGGGVDTGFGLSLSGREADETRRVFANVEQNEGLSVEDVEEILTG